MSIFHDQLRLHNTYIYTDKPYVKYHIYIKIYYLYKIIFVFKL